MEKNVYITKSIKFLNLSLILPKFVLHIHPNYLSQPIFLGFLDWLDGYSKLTQPNPKCIGQNR